MKKVFLLLSLLGVAGLCFAQTVPAGLEYKINGNNVTIKNYKGNATSVVIPDRIQGLPVTIIWVGAFRRTNLTSVTIPDSVTVIGSKRYYSSNGAFQNRIRRGARHQF